MSYEQESRLEGYLIHLENHIQQGRRSVPLDSTGLFLKQTELEITI